MAVVSPPPAHQLLSPLNVSHWTAPAPYHPTNPVVLGVVVASRISTLWISLTVLYLASKVLL